MLITIAIVAGVLVVTNGLTLWWALNTRVEATPEVIALHKALNVFNRDGISLLKIEQINPDDIFLRNPNRSIN